MKVDDHCFNPQKYFILHRCNTSTPYEHFVQFRNN